VNRRGFIGSILALGAAPAIVRAESLMRLYVPKRYAFNPVIWAPPAVGPIRFNHVFLYNAAAKDDGLIAYFDYGTETLMPNGETFSIDFAKNSAHEMRITLS
jgi:hypothetical protein